MHLAPKDERMAMEASPATLARWEELGVVVNVLSETERGVWINRNRVAVDSWKRAEYWTWSVTWLYRCDCCGRLRIPRNIRSVPAVWWYFGDFQPLGFEDVCVSCWNKLRAQENRILELYDLEKLVKRVDKVRLECQRRTQQRV